MEWNEFQFFSGESYDGYVVCNFFHMIIGFTSEQFWQFLVEMEDDISIAILARYCVGPQLLHEENLVCKLWG